MNDQIFSSQQRLHMAAGPTEQLGKIVLYSILGFAAFSVLRRWV